MLTRMVETKSNNPIEQVGSEPSSVDNDSPEMPSTLASPMTAFSSKWTGMDGSLLGGFK